ncbi:MAG: hypothetical protein ABSA73_14925 [Terracidiphilus sp.]|jgi:hypothetical protein
MKILTTLLVAVALFSPAFAQKITFQGTHPKPKLATVAPAAKPVLLHTGKPITPDQKRQLMATVTKGSATRPPMGAAKVSNSVLSAELNLLTPDQLYVNGAYIDAFGARIDQFDGVLSFPAGPTSSMVLNITVKANTAYTLLIKMDIQGALLLPPNTPGGIIISTYSGAKSVGGLNAPQTFNAPQGENEFAYSFVANSAGNLPITISSPDLGWSFESCEITSAPF